MAPTAESTSQLVLPMTMRRRSECYTLGPKEPDVTACLVAVSHCLKGYVLFWIWFGLCFLLMLVSETPLEELQPIVLVYVVVVVFKLRKV